MIDLEISCKSSQKMFSRRCNCFRRIKLVSTSLIINYGGLYYCFTVCAWTSGLEEASCFRPTGVPFKALSSPTKSTLSYTPGRTIVEKHDTYEHEDLRPSFPDKKWPALEELPYSDKGLLGSDTFKDLLATATEVFDYVPKIGTEVHGVDLANLTDAAKNDLARLISIRGVVFFRNQKNFGIEAQRKLGSYFGTLHKHATTSVPKRGDLDDVHVVYTDENSKDQRALFTPTFLWHSDVTYEIQPPSYTSLKVLTGPPRGGGGDTLWSSQYAAYDALSAPMQNILNPSPHSTHPIYKPKDHEL
ncbi:e3626376-9be8-4431-afa5-2ab9e9166c2c [Sclerotinia trifoliorum]|uniref:E3626376-9be8-4431-afa5-2ab9e9166c2c n=1 Tax=Sclerotinia trifoliorum TaxID=28548 RepID=A0A8H2ZLV2_9HELO|nr:e3626376-9be8-4431-afa5-2ab9e9166c2c [Sclerotinia trifoliorum]